MKVTHITTSDMSLRYLLFDQLRYLKERGYDVTAVSGPGPWVLDVRSRGLDVTTVPLTRRIAPFEDARAFLALAWHLARTRPDVIHTHTPKASLLGQWAAWLVRIKHRVHTIHGLYFPGHMRPERRWFYVWLERLQMAPAHAILSQNAEDIATVERERIADPGRLRYLGNGIDITRFTPANAAPERRRVMRERLGLPQDGLVVGMVGRLVREKGYPEFFEAARLILPSLPDTTFIAIGGPEPTKADGIEPDDPMIIALGDRLKLLGHRDDVDELYGVMDLLVLPSHREGFPRAPMEAAATGVPVIATNIRGCRETVLDGETGRLIPVRDAHALAQAVLELLHDGELRVRMGARARAVAEERFDQVRVFQRVADVYASLARS